MNKIPMTASGYEDIQNELKKLINIDRPDIIAAIIFGRSSFKSFFNSFWISSYPEAVIGILFIII